MVQTLTQTPYNIGLPLTFCASCALKRFENLWNVPSFMFVTGFSLLGWFYW